MEKKVDHYTEAQRKLLCSQPGEAIKHINELLRSTTRQEASTSYDVDPAFLASYYLLGECYLR